MPDSRGELRINARRTEKFQLCHAVIPGAFDDIGLDREDTIGQIGLVKRKEIFNIDTFSGRRDSPDDKVRRRHGLPILRMPLATAIGTFWACDSENSRTVNPCTDYAMNV
jgi:hypothetical protein